MTREITLEYWTHEGTFVGRLREVPCVCGEARTLPELARTLCDAYALTQPDILSERELIAAPVCEINGSVGPIPSNRR